LPISTVTTAFYAAGVQGMFDCPCSQFGMVAAAMHGCSPGGHVAEDGGQVEILEGSSPQDRRRHLAGDRQDWRLVELGVIQAGEHVGRARPGDREADGGSAGELAVRAGREGRRTLVPDPDVGQLPALLGSPHGSAKPRLEWPTIPNTA
jgi:hypothetical protein